MTRRARLLSVVAILATGALGLIASTQTWLVVTIADGAQDPLPVPGADAITVLAPLSLAVLALGGALSIVGTVLRYVFGALTVLIGGILIFATADVVFAPQARHVGQTVTDATGITGEAAVQALVSAIAETPWPVITLVGWIVLVAGGILTLVTAHRWKGAGRRYQTAAGPAGSRPHDAIDDWDDLSRGEDPTA